MNVLPPKDIYRKQWEKHSLTLSYLQKKRTRMGWARLGVFLLTVSVAYVVFTSYGVTGLIPTIVGIGVLLYLVSIDVATNAAIRNTQTLIQINEEEGEVIDHRFFSREEGNEFVPAEHAYAADLDIFGKASVYQWLNRCYTEQGKRELANNLLASLPLQQVLARQEAVQELTPQVEWRQQWQAYAMQTTITGATQQKMKTWLKEEEEPYGSPVWKWILPFYSTITVASALAAIVGFIPGSIFSTLFLLYFITSLLLSRKAIGPYVHLSGIVKQTATLQALVDWFEGLAVKTGHLQNLQKGMKSNDGPAGRELSNLKKILDRFDLRSNIVGLLIFNSFLLWDVRQLRALHTWRSRNRHIVESWFTTLAEVEVLHSISTLYFNVRDWSFPQFTEEHFTFKGVAIGHPLLPPTQRVTNTFDLKGKAKIGLITGSNMAGKSTFLRSLGVNVVLAQLGAPVCAASFLLSPVQVVSSMRIADNLAENTSTFYAELKKLRTIIEKVKTHEPLFILLDEILRGTNSYDRHTGAAALIKQLIKEEAVAVIATHDVELAAMEKGFPDSVHNYHFDVEVEGEELYFDYKLKEGVCRSMNASILMKKIGIDL